ncbi:unnamed protein product [Darwinula stevensoni]|uniref:Secreted protein n=1 Tax=Darwinula stevensoni TaxID=69355 RepID=A0A7R9AG56_9CRUS|nr:unnamed protein product [Darwinula stevensoni]CAG0903587.1 unnamed protein product [Darwinula stevensoni]
MIRWLLFLLLALGCTGRLGRESDRYTEFSELCPPCCYVKYPSQCRHVCLCDVRFVRPRFRRLFWRR